MKVIMNILDKDPPTLPSDQNWSKEFRNLISSCLVKDPNRRPNVETVKKNNQAFFSKAQNSTYLVEHLIKFVSPLQ
jgi:serine/threonine-protein kinase OSR1/STK39